MVTSMVVLVVYGLYVLSRGQAGHEVIIYWSEEDEVFVADVPALPGCAVRGATQEAALGSAQDAIRLWIDTADEFGDPMPETIR
jgi:predicted RNase H-like HicB family nuclease